MTDKDYGMHYPGNDRPFFLYDPEGEGFMFYKTAEARDAAAKASIDGYLEDGEWSPSVETLYTGCLTHRVMEVDRQDRPEDPEVAEDEGWPEDCEYRCNYELRAFPRPLTSERTTP